MKILLVNERLPYASTSFYSLALALALQKDGDQVCLCTRGGELCNVFRARRIKVFPTKANLFSQLRLIQFLRAFSPDLIHIQNIRSIELGQKLSRKLEIPHIVTIHRVLPPTPLGLEHRLLAGVISLIEMIRSSLVN